jgi:hypothetical protein
VKRQATFYTALPIQPTPASVRNLQGVSDELVGEVGETVTERRAHASGPRHLPRVGRRVLDAYEQVALRHPVLPPGTLVIEHAFLADAETRARAVRLGVGSAGVSAPREFR